MSWGHFKKKVERLKVVGEKKNLGVQWCSQFRGKGAAPLDSEKIVNNREKEGKIGEKRGKNWEEKAKIGKVLSLWPPDK